MRQHDNSNYLESKIAASEDVNQTSYTKEKEDSLNTCRRCGDYLPGGGYCDLCKKRKGI